jgi:hypothetical protein
MPCRHRKQKKCHSYGEAINNPRRERTATRSGATTARDRWRKATGESSNIRFKVGDERKVNR